MYRKQNKEWFFSTEGIKYYSNISSLKERALFLYSYLKKISNSNVDRNNFIFRVAFLLADAVCESSVDYSQYPAIIDPKENPFVAYVSNAEKNYSDEKLFAIFYSIIHGIANPMDKNNWIYNHSLFTDDGYIEKLKELEHCYVADPDVEILDPRHFMIDENLKSIQLMIIWLFVT